MVTHFASLGGLLFLLTLVHFIVDWGFQSHAEAMAKATNHKVRARHCLIYTAGLAPVVVLGVEGVEQGAFCLAILFASHFLIDTYMPVYLWAKYLRRPPTMADNESVAPLS